MRANAYHLFEIVAWPAVMWCGVEVVARTATASYDGLAMTVITGTLAALTIFACRARTQRLVSASG